MKESTRNLIVGTFVLGGIIALGTMVVLFGMSPRLNTYPVELHFRHAAGLRAADSVLLHGHEIGTVGSVEFKDPDKLGEGMVVVIRIDQQYSVPGNVAPRIETPGAIGLATRSYINLLPGAEPAPPLPKDGTAGPIAGIIKGGAEILPPELIDKVDKAFEAVTTLSTKIEPVLVYLAELLEPRSLSDLQGPLQEGASTRPKPNLSTTVERIDLLLANVNSVVGDPEVQDGVKQSIANIREVTQEARGVVAQLQKFAAGAERTAEKAEKLADGLIETNADARKAIETIRVRAAGLLDNLDKLVTNVNGLVDGVKKGEGTLGKLVKNPKLYDELAITAERLNKALDELRGLIEKWKTEGVKWNIW